MLFPPKRTPSISISLGDFTQSGGTNQVGGNVTVGTGGAPAAFTLDGGLLSDLNVYVDASNPATPSLQQALFTQTGGTHFVSNLLCITVPPASGQPPFGGTGAYVLSGGLLTAPNIQLDAQAIFDHEGGVLTTSGLLNLAAATWYENTEGQQFGQLLLSVPAGSNAVFSLPAEHDCTVHFADSSSVLWSTQATLFIDNWNGSPTGGGRHQFVFGSSASSLTAQQLSQILFRNPGGATGVFPARILSTGEIVPARFIAARKSSNNLLIEWSGGTLQSATNVVGPYQDLTGASSPYTAPLTDPTRFFRLRQPPNAAL